MFCKFQLFVTLLNTPITFSFQQIIMAKDLSAVKVLGEAIKDRRSLASTLLRIFVHEQGGTIRLLQTLTESEINAHGKLADNQIST